MLRTINTRQKSNDDKSKVGLVLTGGGARAAYQVGVLRAIAEMLPDGARNPFPVICGTSAGAINAASLAVAANEFQEGVRQLEDVWANFHVGQVYRSDFLGVLKNSMHCLVSLFSDDYGRHRAISLLDNAPLKSLLSRKIPLRMLQHCIRSGSLHALGITAWGYTSGQSVTFYQAAHEIEPWKRAQRVGVSTQIRVSHLMASSAIPFFFPPIKLNREFFGDGSMRQLTPISPALHLGADKIMILGVHKVARELPGRVSTSDYPSLAQIAGHAMNSIFVDGLDVDLERLRRINQTLKLVPPEAHREKKITLRPIDSMMISPSIEINEIAQQFAQSLPFTMRSLYRAVGAMNPNGSTLLSYVLFEASFCKALIELGHHDALQQKDEILEFIQCQ
ncbi:NTE family protein [Nitrosomonas sp. Nm51]|uniref:patatin-like phospholipase family protein n=1 Tax=Nitrosomonas sp. Nm51 TaxID=133720 RepID=UPI0008B00CA5|nr:patatin-like phospholipase family protein [Nitrosomonas sp. Nm51]SEQ76667.1 NTE family protein [Nitrosomonas sp. Nm51]